MLTEFEHKLSDNVEANSPGGAHLVEHTMATVPATNEVRSPKINLVAAFCTGICGFGPVGIEGAARCRGRRSLLIGPAGGRIVGLHLRHLVL